MIICSAAANAARLLFVARQMLWACRAVVCEVGCLRKRAPVLTGMRQKSATQFGGVPRLSRLFAPEVMILSYNFFAHIKFIGKHAGESTIFGDSNVSHDRSFPPSPPF